jgi:hypothetical protein
MSASQIAFWIITGVFLPLGLYLIFSRSDRDLFWGPVLTGIGIIALIFAIRGLLQEEAPSAALPTARAGHTPSIPGLFHLYGGGTECSVVIEGDLLMKWQDKYDAALVCGLNDNAVDRMHQTAIAISEPYTIGPHEMTMTVAYGRGKLLETVEGIKAKMHPPEGAHMTFPAVYNIILLPKNIDEAGIASITSIGDVPNHGGLIVEAEAGFVQVQ